MSRSIFIFDHEVAWYILLPFIGIWVVVFMSLGLAKLKKIDPSKIFRTTLFVFILGAIINSQATNMPMYFKPFAFFASYLGITCIFYVIGKLLQSNGKAYAEIGIIGMLTYMIFSKLGCFFAGCCHGKEYHGLFAIVYPQSSNSLLKGIPLFPIQLLDVATKFVILCIFLYIMQKDFFKDTRIIWSFCLVGASYYWPILFWYQPANHVNQWGINFVMIYLIIFGSILVGSILYKLYNKGKFYEEIKVEKGGC